MLFYVICNFEAPSDENLRMHIRKEHDDRVLSCEKCEVTCTGRTKSKMHIRTHMTVTCKHCGKKILYNSRTSHMKQCFGEKTYNCENCPALFNREDHLKVHVNKRSSSIQCNLWAHIYGFSPVCFHSVSSKCYNQSKHHCKHCM